MNTILKKMEKIRTLMIQSAMENGLQSTQTIRLSRQVDELHNQYNKEKGYPHEEPPTYNYYEN